MCDYIEAEADRAAPWRKFWDSVSVPNQRRILDAAFPDGSYIRPEKGTVFIAAPASIDTTKLREALEWRGFEPLDLADNEESDKSVSERIEDSLDRADLVLVVVPHRRMRSPSVFIELGYALAKKKRVLALIPPDEESPLGDVPYLRAELDNGEAIGLGIDQVLAAARRQAKGKAKGKSRRNGVTKTKPIGTAADRLLDEAHAHSGELTARDIEKIVLRAIEQSGVSIVVGQQTPAHHRVDLAVWSDDLDPAIKNPVVIEVKCPLRGKTQFDQAIARLGESLDRTNTQLGVLIYSPPAALIDSQDVHDPRILVFSLDDFLRRLKHNGFGEVLRRGRNIWARAGSS